MGKITLIMISESAESTVFFTPADEELIKDIDSYFVSKAHNPVQKHTVIVEDFKNKYKIDPDTIVARGSTDVSNSFASRYIESVELEKADRRVDGVYTYKCFANHDTVLLGNIKTPRWKTNADNLILHEDASSAWNCLMKSCRNPKFGAILRINHGQ